jgi:hypothetical protein
MLLVAQILLGFPFGTFQTMTVAYASELMPGMSGRAILRTMANTEHSRFETFPHHLRQLVLGSWSGRCLWCHPCVHR